MEQAPDAATPRGAVTDPDVLASYETDWTGRRWGRACGAVRPSTVEEVVAVLTASTRSGRPLVVQGGNTGLVGGGNPVDGQLVLRTTALAGVDAVDVEAGEIVARAGTTLAAVRSAARDAGWDVGVDLAARDSATVGGMYATNAGGALVLRHGPMKAQVLGMRAVLPDGGVLDRLHGPSKDNSGYDLVSLLGGSEGTLAVTTDLRLRLVPVPAVRLAALVPFDGLGDAAAWLAAARPRLPNLAAAELVTGDGLDLVCAVTAAAAPFPRTPPVAVLLELQAAHDPMDELAAVLVDRPGDIPLGTDAASRARLWALRERHSEAVNSLGMPLKLDVAVPRGALDAVVDDVRKLVREVDGEARLVVFGHLAEGNLHLNVVGPALPREELTDAVLRRVAAAGGSISAEHGIGRAKRAWLPLTRSAADLAAMRAVKAAWDPCGVLGAGVLLT